MFHTYDTLWNIAVQRKRYVGYTYFVLLICIDLLFVINVKIGFWYTVCNNVLKLEYMSAFLKLAIYIII